MTKNPKEMSKAKRAARHDDDTADFVNVKWPQGKPPRKLDHSKPQPGERTDPQLTVVSNVVPNLPWRPGFGPQRGPVDQVLERDVDLLLLEELMTACEFPSFFARVIFGSSHGNSIVTAWNSVTEAAYGESDLVVVWNRGSERSGLLIENKIRAIFMPQQAERYRVRGEEGRKKKWWDRYETCLLAPARYLSNVGEEHNFDYRISYESLLPYFHRLELGLRGRWRAEVLEQACSAGTVNSWIMVPDAGVSQFFIAYWELANREFPQLRLIRKDQRPSGSTWIYFRNCGLPRGVSLVHKAAVGSSCDLTIRGAAAEELAARTKGLLEPDMRIVQTGKSAGVRIATPSLDVTKGFDGQREAALIGLKAASCLLAFSRVHADRLQGHRHR